MSFFKELKRRNVVKVGFVYLITAWVIAQVLELVFSSFGTPEWVMKTVLVLLVTGFVLSLLLAWAYELTPDGIRKESELAGSVAGKPHPKLYYMIVGIGALVAVYLFTTRQQPVPVTAPRVDSQVVEQVSIESLGARPSVIVLPFANISGDEARDYLAFGLTDELISGLQQFGSFPVISRSASLSYNVNNGSALDFASSHGASYLVEGSVNMGKNGIRVLASLTNAEGSQVWAERYQLERQQVDIFDVSDELISKIAGEVLKSEVNRVQRKDHPPSDAWEHYIKGLKVVLEYDQQEYQMARQHLDRAVEIAPQLAEAWWALGELEIMNYMSQPLLKDADLDHLYELIGYFRKAHEISPFMAAACGCLGYMLTAVGQPDAARVVFEQAIEAKPLSPDLRVDYALHLTWAGRYEEALEHAALALKLGPVSIDRAGVWAVRSMVALAQGNEHDALDAVNRSMFINKDTFFTPMAVAILYVLGQHDDALMLFNDMQDMFPDLQPKNPVFYVTLKPIDDILARRREQGEVDIPVDVEEIFSTLRGKNKNQST